MKLDKLFCVIDPTINSQRSLDRARFIASQGEAEIHAFLCFTLPYGVAADDDSELEAAERRRHELWLEELVQPLRDSGVTVTTELICSDDWRASLARAVAASDADLVIKSAHRRSPLRRRFMKTSDWLVLRDARCPVLFAKRPDPGELKRILTAVNITAKDEPHIRLTETVIATGHDIAGMLGVEMHAVNAYTDSQHFIHPPDLAKKVGLDRNQVHVGDTNPEVLIASVAEKIEASLVIIGSVGRKGMAAAVVGNTAERILDTVNADILSIVQPPEN